MVEGYTDVMACHLAGITTAVATCGTAFGDDHIRRINQLFGSSDAPAQVIFTFDPDAAGQKAMRHRLRIEDNPLICPRPGHSSTHPNLAIGFVRTTRSGDAWHA